MEISENLYKKIKTLYEKELNTAKVGYFRNMTYARKQELLNLIKSEIPQYNVCLSCNTGVLKMLQDINDAKIKYLEKNKNETSINNRGQGKRGRKVKGA